MTVGYFAPMPPAPTGVADYASALYEELRKTGDVRLNQSGGVSLYHLGNNHLHRDIYHEALHRPGIIVLHDAVLQHFFLGSLNERAYIEEFIYNYGPWHADLAAQLWRNRARSGVDAAYFRYPMLRRIAEVSTAIVVHNPAAAEIVRRHAPEARIVEIPHLFAAPADIPVHEIEHLRERLGAPSPATLFGVFGHLRESKRLPVILDALDRVRRKGIDARLLVAGEFASEDLARAMAARLSASHIIRVGYTPEEAFWRHAAAVDACLNLRYPPAGETSGIAIRLMGIGKPVVMTSGAEIERFPETACLRVDAGPAEPDMLAEYLEWLACFPADARAIGERARRHIREHHALDRVAAQYWALLNQ